MAIMAREESVNGKMASSYAGSTSLIKAKIRKKIKTLSSK